MQPKTACSRPVRLIPELWAELEARLLHTCQKHVDLQLCLMWAACPAAYLAANFIVVAGVAQRRVRTRLQEGERRENSG